MCVPERQVASKLFRPYSGSGLPSNRGSQSVQVSVFRYLSAKGLQGRQPVLGGQVFARAAHFEVTERREQSVTAQELQTYGPFIFKFLFIFHI